MLVLKQGQSEAKVLKQHRPIRLSVSEAVSGSVTNPPITRHKGMIDFLPLSIFLGRKHSKTFSSCIVVMICISFALSVMTCYFLLYCNLRFKMTVIMSCVTTYHKSNSVCQLLPATPTPPPP